MTIGRIDQLVPGFAKYDAIGNHALRVRDALRGVGIDSDIYGEWIDPRLASEARPYTDAPGVDPATALLYHSSTHSAMVPWMVERAGRGQSLLSDYHNITPSSYFARWEPAAARSMALAREELSTLAPYVPYSVADSEYNAAELRAVGYARADASPILVDLDAFMEPPDRATLDRLQRRRGPSSPSWLFVGRVAPNKCQHDLVAALAAHRRCFGTDTHLTLVGATTSTRYRKALHDLADELGVADAVDIVDNVGHRQLLAHFAAADVMVCASEHEGFCVPVVEAMVLGVPVVAYAAAALPETLGGAGILVQDKDPLLLACAVDAVTSGEDLRRSMVEAGRRRAEDLSLARTSARMLDALTGWVAAQ